MKAFCSGLILCSFFLPGCVHEATVEPDLVGAQKGFLKSRSISISVITVSGDTNEINNRTIEYRYWFEKNGLLSDMDFVVNKYYPFRKTTHHYHCNYDAQKRLTEIFNQSKNGSEEFGQAELGVRFEFEDSYERYTYIGSSEEYHCKTEYGSDYRVKKLEFHNDDYYEFRWSGGELKEIWFYNAYYDTEYILAEIQYDDHNAPRFFQPELKEFHFLSFPYSDYYNVMDKAIKKIQWYDDGLTSDVWNYHNTWNSDGYALKTVREIIGPDGKLKKREEFSYEYY